MRSLLFALLDTLLAPAPDPRRIAWIGKQDYAHRGLHGVGVPENSRMAFAKAMEQGFGIELDVQLSLDGQAIVFHDSDLDRLTSETGLVSERTGAELGAIALSGTDASVRETIPTLKDVLAQVAGRVPILIEIKSQGVIEDIANLCLAVRRDVEGYLGMHAVMSFDPRVSRWFRFNSVHTTRGLVATEENDRPLLGAMKRSLGLWSAQPDFIAYDVRDLPSRFVARQKQRGLAVTSWTVRSAEQDALARAYVDATIFEKGALTSCE